MIVTSGTEFRSSHWKQPSVTRWCSLCGSEPAETERASDMCCSGSRVILIWGQLFPVFPSWLISVSTEGFPLTQRLALSVCLLWILQRRPDDTEHRTTGTPAQHGPLVSCYSVTSTVDCVFLFHQFVSIKLYCHFLCLQHQHVVLSVKPSWWARTQRQPDRPEPKYTHVHQRIINTICSRPFTEPCVSSCALIGWFPPHHRHNRNTDCVFDLWLRTVLMSGSDCNWTQFDVRRSDRGTVLWTQTVPVVQCRPARAVYVLRDDVKLFIVLMKLHHICWSESWVFMWSWMPINCRAT